MADFAERFLGAYDQGRQRRLEDDALAERKRANKLLGQAYADPSQRAAILPELASIDADTAFKADQQFSANDERTARQRANLSRIFVSVPPEGRASVAQRFSGEFQRLGMDVNAPDFEQIATGYAQMGAGPAAGGKVVGNALVDPITGRVIYQGPEVPVNAQIVGIPDGAGGEQKFMFDPKTRQLMDLPTPGGGSQAPQRPGALQPDSVEMAIQKIEEQDGPLPPDVRQKLKEQMQRGGSFTVANRPGGAPTIGPDATNAPSAQPPPVGGGRLGYTPPKGAAGQAGTVATLTPEEVAQAGFPAGSVVQRKPDGTLIKQFSPTERDSGGGRALPANVVNGLAKDAEKLRNLADLTGAFSPDFAGNVVGGSIENMAGRLGGARIGVSTPGQAEWWQQYDRHKNVIRNELFGSALTPSEQAAFEAADITPNMDPGVIGANLAEQAKLLRLALERKAEVWAAQGYNPAAVQKAANVDRQIKSAADLSDDDLKRELGL